MFKRKGTPGSSRSTSPVAPDIDDIDSISVISMGEDIPPPINVNVNVIENDDNEEPEPAALNEDPALNPDIHFRYTTGHPMGSILLRLLNENTRLAERIGHRSMDLSAQELSTQFYNWQLFEKQRMKSKIKQTAAGLEDSILNREMQSHTINQSIEAPSNFSPVPTLLTARQRADCFKLLPSGPNKFSGDKGVSILEYLHNLKSLQSQLNLSQTEFYEAMLASTTGNAYLLINSWVENKESPSTIFHNLLIHYDTRLQPEEARARLMAYKALKSSNLGKVEADIMKLATRAASSIPAGPGRTSNYNNEVVQCLIRCLPHASSLIVQNTNNEKSAKLGRMLTAAELSRYLNIYRHAIDSDIRTNGADNRVIINKRFNPRIKGEGVRKFVTYNITREAPPIYKLQAPNLVQGRPFHLINQLSHNNKPVALRGRGPVNTGISNRINNFSNSNGQTRNWSSRPGTNNVRIGRNSGFRGGKTNPSFPLRNQFGQRMQNSKEYCSLCGRKDHKATDGCRFMISDEGAQVPIMPTKTTCTKCPSWVNPRLSHPENLCPYRRSGVWGKQ